MVHLSVDNPDIKSNNSDNYSIVKSKHNNTDYFPEMINDSYNKSFLIQINELATGDFYSLLETENIEVNLFNAITQILISIMFFHNYTKSYHNDLHAGNFLYHKIKP